LSIQRPEYLSNEGDLESDPGAFVTSHRILISAVVVFLGSLKTTFAYSSFFTDTIWVEWLLGGLVSSLCVNFNLAQVNQMLNYAITSRLYLVGLYESNSLGLWSSFFRKDRSHLLHLRPFIDPGSDSENVAQAPIPIIVSLAFFSVVYGAKILPGVKHIPPHYFKEHTTDFQLPMGPTISKGTLDEVRVVVLVYIPSIVIFVFCLGHLIFYLRIPILATTSMLPSAIQHHTGRFVGAVERRASLRPLPFPVAVLILLISSLPKTSYSPDTLSLDRIRTAPSVCGLQYLGRSLRLFHRCTPQKPPWGR
jgi:hypothetical protein